MYFSNGNDNVDLGWELLQKIQEIFLGVDLLYLFIYFIRIDFPFQFKVFTMHYHSNSSLIKRSWINILFLFMLCHTGLCSRLNLGGAQGAIWDVWEQTWVKCVPGECPIYCTVTLTTNVELFLSFTKLALKILKV